MPAWLSWIVSFILKGFGIGQASDPVAQATATGEKLGKTETGEENAVAGLREIDTASKARSDAATDLTAHSDRVRAPDPDMAARDSSGIS